MLEYLEYLKDNLGLELDAAIINDTSLSAAIYDCDEEEQDETNIYDLIDGYLELCKDVKNDYDSLFENMDEEVTKYDDNQVSILLSNMKISDVEFVEDGDDVIYSFELSSVRPIEFSIRLSMLDISDDNDINRSNGLMKSDPDSNYQLIYDKKNKDVRSIVMAGLFNEWVNLDSLYSLLERMYLVNKKLIYTPHALNNLPFSLELYDMGKVDLYYAGGNDRELILQINGDGLNTCFYSTREEKGLQCNFGMSRSRNQDPIWVLYNTYVYSDSIPREIAEQTEYDDLDNLAKLFKKAGYSKTKSYIQLNNSSQQTCYYVYEENNELSEIRNYESVSETEKYYEFDFEDGSYVTIPKDKVVVATYNSKMEYLDRPEALKSLNLKMG